MHDDLLPSKERSASAIKRWASYIKNSKLARQLIARQTTTDAVCPLGKNASARNGVGKGNNSDYQDGLASLYSLVMTPAILIATALSGWPTYADPVPRLADCRKMPVGTG